MNIFEEYKNKILTIIKKAEKEKRKLEKTAVITRSKGVNDSQERHKNIVQSVLNRQEVDDRTRYPAIKYT